MTETKSGRVFRNKSSVRSFVLSPRIGETKDFILGPLQTIQAQSEIDERILGMYVDIVDVEKESPAVGASHEALRQEALAEREINKKLREENEKLQAELAVARGGTTETVEPARRGKKK